MCSIFCLFSSFVLESHARTPDPSIYVSVCVSDSYILLLAGHMNILKWLLSQKECSGNERDYYQSTPMHDAAERGNLK